EKSICSRRKIGNEERQHPKLDNCLFLLVVVNLVDLRIRYFPPHHFGGCYHFGQHFRCHFHYCHCCLDHFHCCCRYCRYYRYCCFRRFRRHLQTRRNHLPRGWSLLYLTVLLLLPDWHHFCQQA